jgi:hypothetical protein
MGWDGMCFAAVDTQQNIPPMHMFTVDAKHILDSSKTALSAVHS